MKLVWCLVLAVLMVGCMPGGSTASGSALVHPNFPYAVSYDDPQAKSVLGADWKLETYRRKDRRAPTDPIELERKKDFEATYEFDFNDDDLVDARVKLPIPDLQLVNKRTDARLEVVTLLLDSKLADKELRLLLKEIVDRGSGARALFVGFGRSAASIQKRFATRLIDSQEASLGGQKGVVATLEHADLDQLELNPNARSRRTRLFMMRAPFDYFAREGNAGTPNLAKFHKYRVLMLVEYSNTPEDFDAQYPEFLRLMSKLHLVGDVRMLGYLQEALAPCAKEKGSATLFVDVSAQGEGTLRSATGLDQLCAGRVIKPYPFAATGQPRLISGKYDFSVPLEQPDWMALNEYVEQPRTAASPAATETPAAAPTAAPSDTTAVGAPVAPPTSPTATGQPAPAPSPAAPTPTPAKSVP